MTKKHISLTISPIKNCDRTNDGNLKPEAKEKTERFLKEYLENTGRANISEISEILGLSRQTTKNLINEILAEWHEEIEDQTIVQAKWIESTLREIDCDPDAFNKERIAVVNLKSSLLNKLNALQKFALKEDKNVSIFIIKNNQTKKLSDDKPP
jgi:hypothetical protein